MFDTANPTKFIRLDRRKFMAGAAGLIAAGVLPKNVFALAGPYSFKQGNYDVTVVSDGTLTLPMSVIDSGGKDDEVKMLLGPMLKDDKFQAEASPLLLKSDKDLILIDTGSGQGFQDTAGKIAESLKAAGVDPASITKVVYTHAHPDHLWGTTGADGKTAYTGATFHMAEAEFNFWSAPDLATKMPSSMETMVKNTANQLAMIKDKISLFKTDTELAPGIGVMDTAGHTPGHVSFELAGGDGLIITGDAITNPVFFAHPDWKFGFDANHDGAIANRKKLLGLSSNGKKQLLGYHWPYPGLARAEAKDGGFTYVPA